MIMGACTLQHWQPGDYTAIRSGTPCWPPSLALQHLKQQQCGQAGTQAIMSRTTVTCIVSAVILTMGRTTMATLVFFIFS